MTDTPHTRESETELREILAQELDKKLCHGSANMIRKRSNMTIHELDAALAAMRRVSTPLTPSDEMVEAAVNAFYGTEINCKIVPQEAAKMRAAITAALNLMGGKK